MANELILPLMGEGVVEAQIGRWLIEVGDEVNEGDPIVEVETDKVTTELESEFSGTLLEILVPEGETAVLHQPLALIGEKNGQKLTVNNQQSAENTQLNTKNTPTPISQSPNPTQSPSPKPQSLVPAYPTPNTRISPVVKRMVAEHQLDLALIAGTGKNGRITKRDVEAYLRKAEDEGQKAEINSQQTISNNQQSTVAKRSESKQLPNRPAPQSPNPPMTQSANLQNSELMPLSNMRRRIAEHMVFSKQESPHATTVFEIDFEAVANDRRSEKENFAQRGVKLTYMAYIGMAVVTALQQVPTANAQWQDEGILLHRNIHLGMATAVDNGLIVPVIKNADTLNLFGMATAVDQLAQKGRAGKLQSGDLQGGTFTITNHGVFGSLFATPIINQPQSGILGIGTIEKRVCVVDDMIAIRPKSYFSLSFDHRILDGADADRFVQIVKQTIENWS